MTDFFEGKICRCEEYYAAIPVKITPDLTVYPNPPGCRTCGLWPPHPLRECETCCQVYYRWFTFLTPTRSNKLDCWDCTQEFFRECNGRSGDRKDGAIPPPECVIPPKRSRQEHEDILAKLLAALSE